MYEPTTMVRIAVYIVVKDGSGDFSSIQQAIDAIPGGVRRQRSFCCAWRNFMSAWW